MTQSLIRPCMVQKSCQIYATIKYHQQWTTKAMERERERERDGGKGKIGMEGESDGGMSETRKKREKEMKGMER